MRVLVTGSQGFLGSHLTRVLTERGHSVVLFDLPSDVRDPYSVKHRVSGCDHVIHLAGVLGTAELFADPHKAVDVNVHGTLNVLRACAEHGAGYAGITMPRVWSNPYQATKGCAADLASAWHLHEGVPVSHVRAFNAYGRGQKTGPVQKIIPTFASRAWRGEPLPVWGDGTQQADLVWAGDVARMLMDAMAFGSDEVFDAGTGAGTSVLEIAEQVIARTGSTAGVTFLPMRKGEHAAKVVARGEGWDALGWHPPQRPERLAETIDSYREVHG